ncbi:MAG: PfkB family carbohydrate kinase [Candidatus Aenigmatarchaeota archaeon]|nr:sugar kinase [Nanoarchaeota archaeon]
MGKLIGLGTIAFDNIKTPAGSVENVIGGTGFYFSVAASLFNPVGVISAVGKDFHQEHLDFLKSRNVDVAGVEIKDAKTFRWAGSYEGEMNEAKTLSTELNLLENFRPQVPDSHKDADYLFLGNIDPEIQLNVIRQMEKPKFIGLDTMDFWIENKREHLLETIRHVNAVFMNDGEARLLFRTNLLEAAKQALDLGPQYVVIKKGSHGAILFSKDARFSIPAYLSEAVDPTGAGDSFAGGFMGWISKTDDLSESNMRKALVYATIIASFNVEGFSLDKLKKINMKDIQNRYSEFKRMMYFE